MITLLKKYYASISYEFTFLVLAGVFGLLFVFITPPFQSPDEPNHYFRAYQISTGGFLGVIKNNSYGGFVPQQLEDFVKFEMTSDQGSIHTHRDRKFPREKITQGFRLAKDVDHFKFLGFANTASYPFLFYIPQSLGILLGKFFASSALGIFYWGRIMGLFVYLIAGFVVIRKVKPYQEIFFVALLLPMALSQASMITADSVSIIGAVAGTAFFITQKHNKESLTFLNLKKYLLVACMLGCIKPVYSLVVGLVIIVPWNPEYSRSKNIALRVLVVGVTALLALSIITIGKSVSFTLRNDIIINASQQLHNVLIHPLKFGWLVSTSFIHSFSGYFHQVVGTFGWLDTSMKSWMYTLGGLLLTGSIVTKQDREVSYTNYQKALIWIIPIGAIFATYLFLFLTWNAVDAWTLEGFQGRYILPVIPLILFAIRKTLPFRISIPKQFFIIGATILLVGAIVVLHTRFY